MGRRDMKKGTYRGGKEENMWDTFLGPQKSYKTDLEIVNQPMKVQRE